MVQKTRQTNPHFLCRIKQPLRQDGCWLVSSRCKATSPRISQLILAKLEGIVAIDDIVTHKPASNHSNLAPLQYSYPIIQIEEERHDIYGVLLELSTLSSNNCWPSVRSIIPTLRFENATHISHSGTPADAQMFSIHSFTRPASSGAGFSCG